MWPIPKKPKKYEKYESELITRLHSGLMHANKENTALYKKIKILTQQLNKAYTELCDISVDRDRWFENYMTLGAKYKELKNAEEERKD